MGGLSHKSPSWRQLLRTVYDVLRKNLLVTALIAILVGLLFFSSSYRVYSTKIMSLSTQAIERDRSTMPTIQNKAEKYMVVEANSSLLPPRTKCFIEAEAGDVDILCDRVKLASCYIEEVESMISDPSRPGIPEHTSFLENKSSEAKTKKKKVRVLQWNINVLHGADNLKFSMPQTAKAAIAIVKQVNPDVILLQEGWRLNFPPDQGPKGWPDSSDRIEELLQLLEKQGYTLVNVEEQHNYNPAMMATRLPIIKIGPTFSLDKGRHNFVSAMRAQKVPELRAARLVSLGLETSVPHSENGNRDDINTKTAPLVSASSGILTVVITHFHHNEQPSGGFGIRAAEAQAIVDECNAWVKKLEKGNNQLVTASHATFLATDFNGVRKVS